MELDVDTHDLGAGSVEDAIRRWCGYEVPQLKMGQVGFVAGSCFDESEMVVSRWQDSCVTHGYFPLRIGWVALRKYVGVRPVGCVSDCSSSFSYSSHFMPVDALVIIVVSFQVVDFDRFWSWHLSNG